MTATILTKKTFSWAGSLTVSEIQSIIKVESMARSMETCRQAWHWLHLALQATGSELTVKLRKV